jgi:hypothetical protein
MSAMAGATRDARERSALALPPALRGRAGEGGGRATEASGGLP